MGVINEYIIHTETKETSLKKNDKNASFNIRDYSSLNNVKT
jgi:hypothetical protein